MEKTHKEEKEKLKSREKIVEELHAEEKEQIEKKEYVEKKEPSPEMEIIKEKLEREVIKMKRMSPNLEEEAEEKAKRIKALNEKGKIKRLLDLAEEKGVAFAVEVARKIKDDPYTLDIFHDILAKDELYKKFLKQ